MTRMRNKCVHCEKCDGDSEVFANMDEGIITSFRLSQACETPHDCTKEILDKVFDRPFDESHAS